MPGCLPCCCWLSASAPEQLSWDFLWSFCRLAPALGWFCSEFEQCWWEPVWCLCAQLWPCPALLSDWPCSPVWWCPCCNSSHPEQASPESGPLWWSGSLCTHLWSCQWSQFLQRKDTSFMWQEWCLFDRKVGAILTGRLTVSKQSVNVVCFAVTFLWLQAKCLQNTKLTNWLWQFLFWE